MGPWPERVTVGPPSPVFPSSPNREGPWSREELSDYFLRACAVFSKLGLGFLHNFHEATFKKPTFCDSCHGFVSVQILPLLPSGSSRASAREVNGSTAHRPACVTFWKHVVDLCEIKEARLDGGFDLAELF